jgi:ornithine--oxo-acid transaminase
MLIVGQALCGGVYPVSAIVSSKAIMEVFTPGIHVSTYGGNPLGAAVGLAALEVIEDEK